MTLAARGGNRGPAAAADNRRALLRAARELFADKGYNVPLSAIAREAGVGQGVLYRHFPSRLDLAFAVFEENFAELTALAEDEAPDAFERVVARMVELMVESVGFVELVVGARGVVTDYQGDRQLAEILTGPLERARAAGLTAPDIGVEAVALALRMIYGVATTARDDDQRRADVAAALSLVTTRWRP
ncbi:TetR/AcrR family transcriptional regulator [Georgenia sp. 311]|uniref:TetR/AcrR family transcriptional regulator n=1 Tax=Georgenia wutianyii TaxID=2585135 RepID=A0ABX5VN92_9MICO|nr:MULTISPECIES: TetR/AcrR family transcriptional regulator [Georgenia]QDB78010.1 TetR/AcrR family transcriptional regulator [Georgenia wutianyii]TNC17945.1 TetR/AcrR family transcriptional regulator [Georgenia sp. 311]